MSSNDLSKSDTVTTKREIFFHRGWWCDTQLYNVMQSHPYRKQASIKRSTMPPRHVTPDTPSYSQARNRGPLPPQPKGFFLIIT